LIDAVIVKRPGGRVVEVRVSGHSGYAPSGSDIVCAAVSAIVQTAILGLKSIPGVVVKDRVGDGELECRIVRVAGTSQCQVDAITNTMVLGLLDIAKSYGDYVQVRIRNTPEVS